MRILLTNDDGPITPALLPTAEILDELGELEIVIPSGNRSGYSKMNTREGNLDISHMELEGFEITLLSGSPADCVNYGVHNLPRPELVVSGMNVGSNLDIGHYYSSGTLGAAFEAVLSEVPAIALSGCYSGDELVQSNFRKAIEITPRLIRAFVQSRPDDFAMLSVNVPLTRSSDSFISAEHDLPALKQLFEVDRQRLIKKQQKWTYTAEECAKGTDRWAIAHGIPVVQASNWMLDRERPETTNQWLSDIKLLHS